ncbi:hypothetical protein [Yoonia sp. SS1-5]|uniref:RNase NYN domain-containing protein n=1 Tax=Yoonia rhodophyticola TaxID=3137370 RepID=A0AAN0MDF3_9RHOB
MRFIKGLTIWLVVLMVLSAGVLQEGPDKVRVLDGLGKGVFASFGLYALGSILRAVAWFRGRRRSAPQPDEAPRKPGQRRVLVDGSNVMHWGGDPSEKVLHRVLQELQKRGFAPLVYFDANVGYKLFNKHVSAAALAKKLGLGADQVMLAPSKTPADEVLLAHAHDDGLRVVTNDRFLDWKSRFPKVGEKGFLIKGMWKEGNVILLGLGRTGATS